MCPAKLRENYVTNVGEILTLARQHHDKFTSRKKGAYKFENDHGEANMYTLFQFDMSDELKNAILRTIPEEYKDVEPEYLCINRYEPGSYLPVHRDTNGRFWRFHLIFLQSDESHFKIYDEEGHGYMVEEKPGAQCVMPINAPHEVTLIKPHERDKYSLVIAWG